MSLAAAAGASATAGAGAAPLGPLRGWVGGDPGHPFPPLCVLLRWGRQKTRGRPVVHGASGLTAPCVGSRGWPGFRVAGSREVQDSDLTMVLFNSEELPPCKIRVLYYSC